MSDVKTIASQLQRLRERFGEKAFDAEFITLVNREVRDLPDYDLVRMVDVFIGTRAHNRPPLIQDFREARMAFEKQRFEAEVRNAARCWDGIQKRPMKEILTRLGYAEANTVWEAVELEREILRLKRQLEEAENAPG